MCARVHTHTCTCSEVVQLTKPGYDVLMQSDLHCTSSTSALAHRCVCVCVCAGVRVCVCVSRHPFIICRPLFNSPSHHRHARARANTRAHHSARLRCIYVSEGILQHEDIAAARGKSVSFHGVLEEVALDLKSSKVENRKFAMSCNVHSSPPTVGGRWSGEAADRHSASIAYKI